MSKWMIYGANGYTGELAAREAVQRGMTPVLAGRNRQAVEALAGELGLESRVFGLDEAESVKRGLRGMFLVLHCAGPFSKTSEPMLEACLAERVHYLDITGEINVFEACHARHAQAREAGVMVLPGTGFDVVPTDCLAAMLARKLPDATSLVLAFEAGGGPSPGTAKTSVEGLIAGGRVRRDGELREVPLAWKTRTIPFADGPRHAMTIPWGDVFTANLSTGIPDIEVYLAVPPAVSARLKRMRRFRKLIGWGPVRRLLMRRVQRRTRGPDSQRREQSESKIWGEVRNASGRTVQGELRTPNGYDLTVDSSLTIVSQLLENAPTPGFQTPSLLLGPDFVAGLKGVEIYPGFS